nr:MAG TPA: hypothetical protein [Caudoviricetes sp.]
MQPEKKFFLTVDHSGIIPPVDIEDSKKQITSERRFPNEQV